MAGEEACSKLSKAECQGTHVLDEAIQQAHLVP